MSISKYHVSKNLFDLSAYYSTDSGITDITINGSSLTYNVSGSLRAIRYRFDLNPSDVYTISLGNNSSKVRLELRYTKDGAQVGGSITIAIGESRTITGSSSYDQFLIYISNGSNTGECIADKIMLNTGSTALPYEPYGNTWNSIPYRKRETATDTITTLPKQIIGDGQSASANIKGNMVQTGTPTPTSPIYPSETGDLVASGEHSGQYQIPILSGGTTTPVYLGEVQSTRQIKKVVFNGTENWQGADTAASKYLSNSLDYQKVSGVTCMSTHYSGANNVLPGDPIPNNSACFNIDPNTNVIYLKGSEPITLADFKTYLQQQYANGTPVTVWYVLATPTTGIVNEPIRKIGNYADSVSVTGIPTTGTAEQFDVDTTLKPSEVSLTYHGWHEHSDTKF